jgi:hypothetical protein
MENNVTVHSQYAASTQESLFRFLDQAFLHLGDAIHLAEDIVLSLSRDSYLTTLFNTEDVNRILEYIRSVPHSKIGTAMYRRLLLRFPLTILPASRV